MPFLSLDIMTSDWAHSVPWLLRESRVLEMRPTCLSARLGSWVNTAVARMIQLVSSVLVSLLFYPRIARIVSHREHQLSKCKLSVSFKLIETDIGSQGLFTTLIVIMYTCHFSSAITSRCENGAVRLADQRRPHSGRVEVCVGGEWLSMCAERFFSIADWTNQNARVVCRQLGYTDVEGTCIHVLVR